MHVCRLLLVATCGWFFLKKSVLTVGFSWGVFG
jgi:hypothetical protein